MRNSTRLGAAAALSILPVAVTAGGPDPTFLIGQGTTLLRVSGGQVSSFDLGVPLRGMATDWTTGRVLVVTDVGAAQRVDLAELQNPLSGTPSLAPIASLSEFYGSIARAPESLYGVSRGSVYSIDVSDPLNPIEANRGSTGLVDSGGAAYDPVTDTFFVMSYTSDALYRVNRHTGAATLVGSFGINAINLGAEWWDGRLYLAAENASSGFLEIGELNPATGAYARVFSTGLPAMLAATSLAIVPEPAVLTSLAVGSMLLIRWSRRA